MKVFNLLNLFNVKKSSNQSNETPKPSPEPFQNKYLNLIQVADILSNHDADTLKEIENLINNYDLFYQDNQEWCDQFLDGIEDHNDRILIAFPYWMVGYDTDKSFGGYIDWKEETENIIWNLRRAIDTLQYPLDLNAAIFPGDETTEKALEIINRFFTKQGYALTCLDTQSDSYHLFIIPENQYTPLVTLAQTMDLKFFRP